MWVQTRRVLPFVVGGVLTLVVLLWALPMIVMAHDSYDAYSATAARPSTVIASDDQTAVFMNAMDEHGNRDQTLIDNGVAFCVGLSATKNPVAARRALVDDDHVDAPVAARIAIAAVMDGSLCPQFR